MNDTQFKEANEMFHAMLVKLKVKQAGKGSVTHKVKDPISKEDCLKIKSSSVLDVDTPGGGGISSSVLSVFFTDKFALSQSDARISVAYKICQWKTLTKHLMKYPPALQQDSRTNMTCILDNLI